MTMWCFRLDLAALYALVDLIERDPEMRELALDRLKGSMQ